MTLLTTSKSGYFLNEKIILWIIKFWGYSGTQPNVKLFEQLKKSKGEL